MTSKKRIVLTLMLKNEERIVERLVTSVYKTFSKITDIYTLSAIFLYDTGSTDNTISRFQSICDSFSIKCKYFQEPFRDFSYSRTRSVEETLRNYDNSFCDFILLLDGDMELRFDDNFRNEDFSPYDCISFVQRSFSKNTEDFKESDIEYYNIRLLSTKVHWVCSVPTHEFWERDSFDGKIPIGERKCICHYPDYQSKIAKNYECKSFWIKDIGDGGCKSDKFERDIRLLTNFLSCHKTLTCPRYSRASFYLARSYRNLNDYKNSNKYYKIRCSNRDLMDEVYISYEEMGHNYKAMYKIGISILSIIDRLISEGNSLIPTKMDPNRKSYLENNMNILFDEKIDLETLFFPSFRTKILEKLEKIFVKIIKSYIKSHDANPERIESLCDLVEFLDELAWNSKVIDRDVSKSVYIHMIRLMSIIKSIPYKICLFTDTKKYSVSQMDIKLQIYLINAGLNDIAKIHSTNMLRNEYQDSDKFKLEELMHIRNNMKSYCGFINNESDIPELIYNL